jgi:DNA-binding NtrC family response regulator
MVLDYRLDGADGLEFYRELKAGARTPPVILVTGYPDDRTVVRALRAGVRDYVTKSPEYLDYLPEAVRRVLAQERDARERRRAEETLRESNRKLEQALAQLWAQADELHATTQQLWQAAKLASVGELAASVAHELNNPLGTVSLRLEAVLARTPADDPRRPLLEVIEGEVERMARLIGDLLQFTRQAPDQMSTVALPEEVAKAVDLIDYHLRRRGVTVAFDFPPALPMILADRQKLRQLFLNLYANATDAMPHGGTLTSRLSTAPGPAGGQHVLVEVADTGAGIPPEHLERVFDPFFTTKEEGKGTGLGLASAGGSSTTTRGRSRSRAGSAGGRRSASDCRSRGRTRPRAGRRTAPKLLEEYRMSQPKPARVLVVDDEVELMRALCDALTGEGFAPTGLSDPREAVETFRGGDFDVLLTDLMMPHMDGIQLLKAALETDPQVVGIVMTGHGTIPTAVEAMKAGAYDYVLKPFKIQGLLPVLRRGLEVRRLRLENVRLRQYVEALTFESSRYTLIGAGPGMRRVVQLIEKVAPTDATVLVRGPSGSGKELVARAIHRNSSRRDRPLVTINCAAMQEALLESELFGHEKGAFTGAVAAKRGLFEVADGGTLFIDEVAEMSPGMQAKLLRVLENGSYRKVGGTEEHAADVRVIAATNKPLEEEQKAGRFREDLFHRLNVFCIPLPALRERREDVPALVEHFLATRQLGKVRCAVDPEAMAALVAYGWPGNVRELANVIERAQILAENNRITPDDLPESVTAFVPPPATKPGGAPAAAPAHPPGSLRAAERRHVEAALRQAHGNKVKTAKALGISRRALYRMIDKHGLQPAADESKTEP